MVVWLVCGVWGRWVVDLLRAVRLHLDASCGDDAYPPAGDRTRLDPVDLDPLFFGPAEELAVGLHGG